MMEERNLYFRNIKLSYKVAGNGSPIILIHGFCGDNTIWEPLVESLSKDHLLIMPDLPGWGSSEALDEESISIEDFAASVKSIMDVEKVGQCIVCGHSMGGYIALALEELYNQQIEGLGILHSHPYDDTDEKKQGRETAIEAITQQGVAEFTSEFVPFLFAQKNKSRLTTVIAELTNRTAKYPPKAFIQSLQAMKNRKDRSHVLKAAQKPVLFIIGEEDLAIPVDLSMKQVSLPDNCIIKLLNTAHMGMYESKEEFLAGISELVALCIQRRNP
ncbi:MAG: alpha/beta hydrolase [Bacteroidetes bacterium]|nr:alpha/beta hydrolase [Bacteroidota bacterium]